MARNKLNFFLPNSFFFFCMLYGFKKSSLLETAFESLRGTFARVRARCRARPTISLDILVIPSPCLSWSPSRVTVSTIQVVGWDSYSDSSLWVVTRRRFAAASLPRLFGNRIPGHTTRAPPTWIGFELATRTNGIQFYAFANFDKTSDYS